MVNQSIRTPAPLPPEELEAALRPFGSSRMLPRGAYVDQAVFDWEASNFFAGGWMCVALSEDLADNGDQRAESVGRAGVLLIRDLAGVVRGFANACRHRGHELLPCGETANRQIVLCPYHHWSYKLDGELRRAPGYHELEGFDEADFGLVELPTEEWHGMVFVDASGSAGPFADHVAGLDEVLAPYELGRLRTAARHDYVVAANWKIMSENYQECYHCPAIHPELCVVSPPESGDNYIHEGRGAWVGGGMDLRDGVATMSIDGHSDGTVLRGLDERRARYVDYIAIFPNVLVSLHPDYVMTHRLTPLGPDRTRIQCSWAFSPEDLGRPGFSPAYAADFWDITNRQDWLACESVQRGLSSPHTIPGVLSDAEDGVYQLVTLIARGYLGLPLTIGALASS